MLFYLRRVNDAFARAGSWLATFGRRARHTLGRRLILVPLLCIISVLLYSGYVTQWKLFVIFDQGEMKVHGTYTRDYEAVLAEAGINLQSVDKASIPKGQISGIAAEIKLIRTAEVTVTLDGVTVPVTTLGGTVAEALQKAGYVPGSYDIIEPPPNTPVEDGMAIAVTRIEIRTVYEHFDIPFETIEQDSQYVNFGVSVTTVEGEDGRRTVEYEVVLQDGKEILKKELSDEIVKEAVAEVIVTGTGGTVKLKDGTNKRYTKRIDVICTAYTTERQVNKYNAIGNVARVGTIAVDPKYIPLRTNVYVTSRNGSWHYGEARTEDTGGKIKENIIDLYFDTWNECIQFGRRSGYLYILE